MIVGNCRRELIEEARESGKKNIPRDRSERLLGRGPRARSPQRSWAARGHSAAPSVWEDDVEELEKKEAA
eukprot:4293640-Pyramimonas_sp.AAC.1